MMAANSITNGVHVNSVSMCYIYRLAGIRFFLACTPLPLENYSVLLWSVSYAFDSS